MGPRDLLIASELSIQHQRERRRAKRSGRPLLLIRLVAPDLLAPGNPGREGLIRKLFSITRQTDLIGWLEQDASLGVVCTESGSACPADAGEAIAAKFRMLLRSDQHDWDERLVEISYSVEHTARDIAEPGNHAASTPDCPPKS